MKVVSLEPLRRASKYRNAPYRNAPAPSYYKHTCARTHNIPSVVNIKSLPIRKQLRPVGLDKYYDTS